MIRLKIFGLVINIYQKGDELMMAMLFAQRVILEKTTFDEVPASLKGKVAEILIESGLPEFVPKGYGGTKD